MFSRALILGISLSLPLLAQLDSNSVTVTASRNATLAPDQVVFNVVVTSGLNTSLDDVIAALPGSGITAANLSYLYEQNTPLPTVQWSFTLTAPLAKLKDTSTLLGNLNQSIAAKKNGLSLSFSVAGTSVSSQSQQSQPCSLVDLIADARTQAQKLATAGGFGVGTILAMSSVVVTTSGVTASSLATTPAPACTLGVKFALQR